MMFQAEFIRGLVFVIAAAVMMASNAFSQVVSDSGTQELHGSALRTPNATASSDRLMRSMRPSLVVTTANGRRVVVGLKKPGLRSRWKNGDRRAARRRQ
ncbi:MAG: hypothetical protein O2817_01760 [Proteobacteria bacterium]|nr:hypothetical protein [Pseudomonadota bacterium]